MARATTTRITARDTNGSSATSLSAITMISADRMKSVRTAPRTIVVLALGLACACLGRGRRPVAADPAPHLLGALVAEVGAAEHQQRCQQPRQELAEHQDRRQDEEQLVAQRPDGDPLDDRHLALGGHAVDVLRRDGGVVDDDARRLGAGPARRGPDVVDRRGGGRASTATSSSSPNSPPLMGPRVSAGPNPAYVVTRRPAAGWAWVGTLI